MLEISEVGMISKEQNCVGDERGLKCVYIPLGMIDKIRLVSSIDCNAILKKKQALMNEVSPICYV